MKVPRVIFHSDRGREVLQPGASFALDERECTHIRSAMRKGTGATVDAVEPVLGRLFRCELTVHERGVATCTILEELATITPPRSSLVLGLPEGSVLESVVEKAVEIGVRRILLFAGERSQNARGRLAEREKLTARLERIACSAIKQSGASKLPDLVLAGSLAEALAQVPASPPPLKLVCAVPPEAGSAADPLSQTPLITDIFCATSENLGGLQSAAQDDDSYVLIGPEGGLTDAEEESARSAGFLAVSLGPQVLRTETAAVAALTILRCRVS